MTAHEPIRDNYGDDEAIARIIGIPVTMVRLIHRLWRIEDSAKRFFKNRRHG